VLRRSRADTLLVGERRRSRRIPSAIRSERSEQSDTVYYAAHMSLLAVGWIDP
jgi:hypothetical protein